MSSSTFTNAYVSSVMQAQDGALNDIAVAYFKISEGGWEDSGVSVVPMAPDPSLVDVDAIVNPSKYPANRRFVFQKSITPDKVTVLNGSQISVECFLDVSEANDNGFGLDPEFYEIGIFSADGAMITHSTFAMQRKDMNRALRHVITMNRTLV